MTANTEPASRSQLFAAWCGPISTALLVFWALLAKALTPVAAAATPAEVIQFFATNHSGIVLGCTVGSIAVPVFTIWTAQLCLLMARAEGKAPLWTLCQVLAGAGTLVFFALAYVLWIVAAYRLDTDPRIVVAFNDAAFLCFLLPWPTASLQMIALAMAGYGDRSERPPFPRALCHFSILSAIVLAGAVGPAFTHSGPFAYDGALGYYLPLAFFALWVDACSVCMILHLRRRLTSS